MNDPYVYLIRGNQFYQQDAFESAIDRYDRCIAAIGKAAVREPYYLRGNAKVANGDYQGAVDDYNSALEGTIANLENYRLLKEKNITIPDDGSDRRQILFNRGNAKAALGRYEEALQDYNKAVRRAPKFFARLWMILFNRGNAKAALGRYEEALQDYNKAVQLARETHSDFVTGMIFFNQANAQTILGKYEEAIQAYNEAIRLATTEVRKDHARFNKGNVLVMDGRFLEARQCYYDGHMWEGDSIMAINIKQIEGVLQSIGRAAYESDTKRGSNNGVVSVIVTVNDGSNENSLTPQDFLFTGNVGSSGNVGGMGGVPGGKGYPAAPPFFVHVKTGNPPPQPESTGTMIGASMQRI